MGSNSEVVMLFCSRNLTRNIFLFLQLLFAIILIILIKEIDEKSKNMLELQLGRNITAESEKHLGNMVPAEGDDIQEEPIPPGPEPLPKGGHPAPDGEDMILPGEAAAATQAQQLQEGAGPQEVEQIPIGEPVAQAVEAPPQGDNPPRVAVPAGFEICPYPGQDGTTHDEPCREVDPVQNPWFPPGAGAGPVNLLELPCPPYSRHFRAPCWKEWANQTKEEIWKNNVYRPLFIEGKNVTSKFEAMEGFWSFRVQDPAKTWRVRCLPYYFIVGLPKCATTDLYVRINFHNEIREPFVKEPQWWETNRFEGPGYFPQAASIHDYIELYDMAGLEFLAHQPQDKCGNPYFPSITGDASTWTFTLNDQWRLLPENAGNTEEPTYIVAHYIRRLIPQARIIVMMRNPTERLYSDYLFFNLGEKTPAGFHNWVTNALTAFNACLASKTVRACIYGGVDKVIRDHLVPGLYHPFLEEWLSLFPREQVLIIHFEEDYVGNQLETLKNTIAFLGLRPYTEDELKWHYDRQTHNTRRVEDVNAGQMTAETRTLLDDFYRPYNQLLASLLNDNRFLWDKPLPQPAEQQVEQPAEQIMPQQVQQLAPQPVEQIAPQPALQPAPGQPAPS